MILHLVGILICFAVFFFLGFCIYAFQSMVYFGIRLEKDIYETHHMYKKCVKTVNSELLKYSEDGTTLDIVLNTCTQALDLIYANKTHILNYEKFKSRMTDSDKTLYDIILKDLDTYQQNIKNTIDSITT